MEVVGELGVEAGGGQVGGECFEVVFKVGDFGE